MTESRVREEVMGIAALNPSYRMDSGCVGFRRMG